MKNIISMHKNKILISSAIAMLVVVSALAMPHPAKADDCGDCGDGSSWDTGGGCCDTGNYDNGSNWDTGSSDCNCGSGWDTGSNYGSYYPNVPSYSYNTYTPPASSSININNTNTNTNTNTNVNNINVNAPAPTPYPTPYPTPVINNLDGYCSANVTGGGYNGGSQTVAWTAYPTGGNGNYSYSWSGSNGLTGYSQTVYNTYNNGYNNGYYGNDYYNNNQGGTQTATVQISSNGQTITRTCSTYVNPPVVNNLSFSCYPNITNVSVNQPVTWSSNVTGGYNGNYTYSWSGTDGTYGYNSTLARAYVIPGTKTATLTITSNGQSRTQSCGTVFVNGIAAANITVTRTPINPAPLSSAVYLSQVPYTGLTDISLKMWLFIGTLSLWSAWVAYMILRKTAVKEMNDEVKAVAPVAHAEILSADDTNKVASFLEAEARKSNVIISEGAITSIMAQAKAEKAIALHILNTIVSKVKGQNGEFIALSEETVKANS